MKQLKILLVEDEKNLARTLAQALRLGSEGRYEVEIVESAEQAHVLIKNTIYDVVISDLHLPGEDGFSLITHIKKNKPETHTILMTGYGSVDVAEKASELTEGYLTKPFDMLDLLLMVQKVVSPTPKSNGHAVMHDDLKIDKSRPILIMEDDLGLRQIYTKALEKSNYTVDEAATLQNARTLIQEKDYGIFICDVHMGRERGTDLLEEFKEKFDQAGTQVVMCSAYGQYRYLTQEVGADFFLEKPISLGTLLTLIGRLMDIQPNVAVT